MNGLIKELYRLLIKHFKVGYFEYLKSIPEQTKKNGILKEEKKVPRYGMLANPACPYTTNIIDIPFAISIHSILLFNIYNDNIIQFLTTYYCTHVGKLSLNY